LSLNAGAGDVDLQGAVGGTTPLSSLSATGNTIAAQAVTTTGLQSYSGTTTLNGNLISNTAGAITVTGNTTLGAGVSVQTAGGAGTDDITFTGTINGAHALSLNAGAGDVDLQGAVGGTTPLSSLSATGNTIAAQAVTTTGAQSYTGAVTLGAGAMLSAGSDITIADGSTLTGQGALTLQADDNITLGGGVQSAGTLILAADNDSDTTGTVHAKGTVSTTTGNIQISASDTTIDLDDDVTAAGDLELNNNTTVADGKTLTAGNDLKVGAGKTLTAEGDLTLVATAGGISEQPGDDGNVQITMAADDKTLTLIQNDSLNMDDFSVTNDEDTDLVADSTAGSITSMTADSWRSITATAEGTTAADSGITLEGSGDITTNELTSAANNISVHTTGGNLIVNGTVTATGGGVSLVADAGTIYTAGAGGGADMLYVPITGYSDAGAATPVGVDLPFASTATEKAAIVIWSPSQDLKLGSGAILTANGAYDPGPLGWDDRGGVLFVPGTGNPIDVAIYLGSYLDSPSPPGGFDVEINSASVWINNAAGIGTLVIDGYEAVRFGPIFEGSLKMGGVSAVARVEAVSRVSVDLATAQGADKPGGPIPANFRLPHADYPSRIADGLFYGTYVLRGDTVLATVLSFSESVPIVSPRPFVPEDQGQVVDTSEEDLKWLEEQGLNPYLEGAYTDSLSTNVELKKAARTLRVLAGRLQGTTDAEINGLIQLVRAAGQTSSVSEEQMAAFSQSLATFREAPDRNLYVAVGARWIDDLLEYARVLSTDMGLPVEGSGELRGSVGIVMDKYGGRLRSLTKVGDYNFVLFYVKERVKYLVKT
jgi:hypothetical protein